MMNKHNLRVWSINHGLVEHSLAAGPAARGAQNKHFRSLESSCLAKNSSQIT